MEFDSITGLVNSATTAVETVGKDVASFIDSGPAGLLTSATDAVTGALGGLGSLFSGAGASTQLPMPNPLSKYASYDYVITISCLSADELANPDTTYMKGKVNPIICASAGVSPANRVTTKLGQFDFFINNIEMNSVIGLQEAATTNVTTFTFDIIEPYSFGMFMVALQAAAKQQKNPNWQLAPYLMTIKFKGNTETGSMVSVPNTTRYIPFQFTNFTSSVTQAGTVYSCNAYACGASAQADKFSKFKSDISIRGATVQEMLQTGEKSLQVSVNQRLTDAAKTLGITKVPDQILIIFPKEVASAKAPTASTNSEVKSSATASPTSSSSNPLLSKLGVALDTNNTSTSNYVQATSDCNIVGATSMGWGPNKPGSQQNGKENEINNSITNVRSKNTIDITQGGMQFPQDSTIENAIEQVILASDFGKNSLLDSAIDTKGFRTWWRLETQVYQIPTKENLGSTGEFPKLVVYRVVTYKSHASKGADPGVQMPGFANLKKDVVKAYDYIYTGKNTDVIKFEINFSTSFSQIFLADSGLQNSEIKNATKDGNAKIVQPKDEVNGQGVAPSKKIGETSVNHSYSGNKANSDLKGGGGKDAPENRVARQFQDILTKGVDMMSLSMDIIGDPYWIAQSGQGNYVSPPTKHLNLNKDGTVNYQSAEVMTSVTFRSPTDINQTTGLYNLSKTVPVISFTGIYQIITVVNHFKNGQFTQTLEGFRLNLQESDSIGSGKNAISSNKTPPTAAAAKDAGASNQGMPGQNAVDANGDPVGNNGWGEGT
jgi:hypothetical protein